MRKSPIISQPVHRGIQEGEGVKSDGRYRTGDRCHPNALDTLTRQVEEGGEKMAHDAAHVGGKRWKQGSFFGDHF